MKKKDSIKDWKRMHDELTAHLTDDDAGERMRRKKESLRRKEMKMQDTGL